MFRSFRYLSTAARCVNPLSVTSQCIFKSLFFGPSYLLEMPFEAALLPLPLDGSSENASRLNLVRHFIPLPPP